MADVLRPSLRAGRQAPAHGASPGPRKGGSGLSRARQSCSPTEQSVVGLGRNNHRYGDQDDRLPELSSTPSVPDVDGVRVSRTNQRVGPSRGESLPARVISQDQNKGHCCRKGPNHNVWLGDRSAPSLPAPERNKGPDRSTDTHRSGCCMQTGRCPRSSHSAP
jgi:hypothetical protein